MVYPLEFSSWFWRSKRRLARGSIQAGEHFMLIDLDKRDTKVLKGLAISAIVFHNYFHVVSPARQNEFHFDPRRFWLFLQTVEQPEQSIQALFSFFGHFGVQVFIFLSAYGLARSDWNSPSDWATFMWLRVKKLYPLFAVAVISWIMLASTQLGLSSVIRQRGLEFVCMFSGLSNILPGYGLPPVGPWWFIPFIIQFYAIWPLMRKLTMSFGWHGLLVLAVLSLVLTHAANPALSRWDINLFETPIARMPVLCFGIAAARYPIRLNAHLALAAVAVLLLGSMYIAIWPFTFIAAVTVALFIYLKTRKVLKMSRLLERLGQYSLSIFLFNGIVRVPFVTLAGSPLSQLVFGCISAAVSFGVAVLMQKLFLPERRKTGEFLPVFNETTTYYHNAPRSMSLAMQEVHSRQPNSKLI